MIWLLGLVVGLVATIIVEPRVRDWFKRVKIAQLVVRDGENMPAHQAKAGTPTMGGAGFIAVVLIAYVVMSLVMHTNQAATGWAVLVAVLIYALVGGVDDSIKIWNHRDEGFHFLPKLTAQIVAAIIGTVVLAMNGFDFVLQLPFGISLNGIVIYAIFTIFWLVGWSNATNLTDGLDGLATGTAIIAYVAYLVLAIQAGNQSVILFDALMIGALVGFLVFNRYPATIFMGDTGSLALGAGLAMNSLVLHHEWSLLLIGFVFMVETLSVMIQVGSFRLFKKRVFLMAPIHHSFEKGGLTGNTDKPWSEWQVDGFFWAVGLVATLIYFVIFN